MTRITIILLAALCSCTGLGETAGDAVGLSWRWQWELRAVCPDGRRDPLDGGEVCTGDVDAWKCRAFPEFCTGGTIPVPPDACGGAVDPAVELALEPEDLGAC